MVARMARRPRRDEPPDDGWEPDDAEGADELELDGVDRGELDAHDAADRRRFSSETAFCPECGAEILDSADICPKCYAWVTDETLAKPRARRALRDAVVWIVILALLAGAGLLGLLRLVF